MIVFDLCVCMLTLSDPMDNSLPRSSVHEILQARIYRRLPFTPPGDLPNPGFKLESPTSPALADRFTWEVLILSE